MSTTPSALVTTLDCTGHERRLRDAAYVAKKRGQDALAGCPKISVTKLMSRETYRSTIGLFWVVVIEFSPWPRMTAISGDGCVLCAAMAMKGADVDDIFSGANGLPP
jgi:hypothetical protein